MVAPLNAVVSQQARILVQQQYVVVPVQGIHVEGVKVNELGVRGSTVLFNLSLREVPVVYVNANEEFTLANGGIRPHLLTLNVVWSNPCVGEGSLVQVN